MRKIYLVLGAALIAAGAAVFHNAVHIVMGIATLAAATQGIGRMRTWGKLFGAVYLVLGLVALFSPDLFGLMQIGRADAIAHLAVGLVFLYVGLLAPPR
jgi:uncharacterized membrane protein HdeD (DUF308 family)